MKNTDQNFSFTKFPNRIIDQLLPELNGSEWLILSVIIRKTIGFHKNWDLISLSQFEKETGMTRNAVKSTLDGLIEKQIIKKISSRNSFKYRLKRSILQGSNKIDITKINGSEIQPENGLKNEPGGYQFLYPPKGILKEKAKEATNSSDKVMNNSVREVIEA